MRNNMLVSVSALRGARVKRRIIRAGIETVPTGMEDATMSRVKQASKRKSVVKATMPALGAAGLTFSLAGSASASTVPAADVPQNLNFSPSQAVTLGEEEIADVSLATFHLFDKENGRGGVQKMAWGCGRCRGCRCGGCGWGGCGGCGGCCASWGRCRWC